jgi:hypothetical protein
LPPPVAPPDPAFPVDEPPVPPLPADAVDVLDPALPPDPPWPVLVVDPALVVAFEESSPDEQAYEKIANKSAKPRAEELALSKATSFRS